MTKTDLYPWIGEAKSRPPDEDTGGLNVADTWISSTHKYFCMAVPKNVCTKIKLVLQQLEGLPLPPDPGRIHYRDTPGLVFLPSIADFPTAVGVEILTSPAWFRFAFVRNPYARLFSAYKSQVMDLQSPYVGFRESIRQSAGYPTATAATPGRVGFGDFVDYIARQESILRCGSHQTEPASEDACSAGELVKMPNSESEPCRIFPVGRLRPSRPSAGNANRSAARCIIASQ